MKSLNIFDWLIGAILVVGGVNWGLIGFFDFNLVSALFGEMTVVSRTVYALVGISALYVAGASLFTTMTVENTRVVHP